MVPQSRSNPLKTRARLLRAGYTISSFAREKGFSRSTVKAAIRGERRTGDETAAILAAIKELPR
jgi:gp16 family phage-associated protein